MKYFKRLSEEPPTAGVTEYFEVNDDFTVARQLRVSADGFAQYVGSQTEPLDEADFSLTEIEPSEFDAIWRKSAKPPGVKG